MTRRHTTLTAAILTASFALPATAAAHHMECHWGVTAHIDPSSSDPAKVRVQAPNWFCSGPVAVLIADAAGRRLGVHGDGSGVHWEYGMAHTHRSAPADTPTRSEPARLTLRLTPRRARAGRRIRFRIVATWLEDTGRHPAGALSIRFARRRLRTDAAGRASVTLRIRRPGTLTAVAYRSGDRMGSTSVRVSRR
jgi:hypothetical protein